MRALLTTLGILAFAAAASAATLKVPQQYGTIQEAVDAAAEGDTILVSKGVYYESVGVETPGLKILGKKAVIDGTFEGGGEVFAFIPRIGASPCLRLYAAGITVQGFTFRNGTDHVQIFAPGCRILKCVSRNAGVNGVADLVVDGTEISGNRILWPGNAGIYASGSGSSCSISRNEIRQAGWSGIHVSAASGAGIDRNVVGSVRDSSGIYVSCSSATVTGNRVSNTGGEGIAVFGSDSVVLGNRVSWASRASGILAVGEGVLVQGNTVAVAGPLVQCHGGGNRILDNRVSAGLGEGGGFFIGGDGLTVSGNVAQQIAEYGSGFSIYNYSSVGAAPSLVERNTAEDACGGGFGLSLYGATVRDCAAVRCGARGDAAGFSIYGSGSTFEDCTAVECHGDGFYVGSGDNDFTTCTATDPSINGFRVYGMSNSFTSCSARGSGGQGFHNAGIDTVLSGGVYLENRLDIANFTPAGASFSGGLGSVLYDSGGETTIPVLYWLNGMD